MNTRSISLTAVASVAAMALVGLVLSVGAQRSVEHAGSMAPDSALPLATEPLETALPPVVSLPASGEPTEVLAAYSSLFASSGPADAETLRARIVAREALADRAAEVLSGQSVSALLAAYEGASNRERLVLLSALGRQGSAESVQALQSMAAEEGVHRLREGALLALVHADTADADAALVELLSVADDRLRAQAVQGLHGHADALSELEAVAWSDASTDVRTEAMHAIGGVGTEAARTALSALAEGHQDTDAQAFARREIARSFR